MATLRRKWRWFLILAIVLVVIAVNVFVPIVAVNAGVSLLAFFSIIVIVISGIRRGSGGIQPQHYQSGSTRNGGRL